MLGSGGPPAERRGVLGAPFAYRPIRRTDRSARPEMILKPLGWSAFGNYDSASGPEGVPNLYGSGDDVFGSGKAVGSRIWLRQRKPGETGLYLGIVCDTNEPTSPPATIPPTSPTSTAIVLSSPQGVEPQAALVATRR